jgi:hypothetical protein
MKTVVDALVLLMMSWSLLSIRIRHLREAMGVWVRNGTFNV